MSRGPWRWRAIPTYAQLPAREPPDFLAFIEKVRRELAARGVRVDAQKLIDELAAERAADDTRSRN